MQIYEVTDPLFKEYGKIIDSVELTELLAEMKHTPVPEDVVYVASEPKLEALAVMKELTDKTYGELPIQIGYCNGHNRKLNALEYHRSSEVDVAATELVLGYVPGCHPVGRDFSGCAAVLETDLAV